LSAVNDISMTNTGLTGTLPATWPDQLGTVSNFIQMDFEGSSGLEGTIPAAWSKFGGRLHQLNLGTTSVNGTIPCSWQEPTVLGPGWFLHSAWDPRGCNFSKAAAVVDGVMVDTTSDASGMQGECAWLSSKHNRSNTRHCHLLSVHAALAYGQVATDAAPAAHTA
jgi:hypothetical protein